MPRRLKLSCITLLLGTSVALLGCNSLRYKPSEAQCGEFADHLVELLQDAQERPSSRIQKLGQEKRDDIITACVRDSNIEEVNCVMAQTNLDDVAANCK